MPSAALFSICHPHAFRPKTSSSTSKLYISMKRDQIISCLLLPPSVATTFLWEMPTLLVLPALSPEPSTSSTTFSRQSSWSSSERRDSCWQWRISMNKDNDVALFLPAAAAICLLNLKIFMIENLILHFFLLFFSFAPPTS